MNALMTPPGGHGGDDGRKSLQLLAQQAQLVQRLAESQIETREEVRLLSDQVAGVTGRVDDLQGDVGLLKTQLAQAIKVRSAERRAIQKAVARVVYAAADEKKERPQHFANVHCGLRDYFKVSEYADIPLSRFNEALKLIEQYDGTGKEWWTIS